MDSHFKECKQAALGYLAEKKTVSTPAQLRAKATYRAKQLSLRTAQAKRVEELEAALRVIGARIDWKAKPVLEDWMLLALDKACIARQALEGSAKP